MKNKAEGKILLKILIVAVFLSFIIFSDFFQKDITGFSKGQNADSRAVSIGHNNIRAFLAEDSSARKKGLGGREGILPDEGMLFIFETPAYHGIWMKDMRFPIDIFWLAPVNFPEENSWGIDGIIMKVVDVRENVLPSSYPEIFTPKAPAKYVLETHASFARENDVKIGTRVSF